MSEQNIKVSIVVATYNHEKYLRHALESIISQVVNFKYEVLIGEDCSTDHTAEIVREYSDKYPDIIIPYIREINLGMTDNSLDLIMRTKGEYIALLEGDDYWTDNDKLQKQVDFLDSHHEYEACFGLCEIVDQNEVRLPDREKYSGFMKHGGDYTVQEFEEYLLPGQTATSMYRQSSFTGIITMLTQSGYDMSRFMDRHLVLAMLARGKLYNSGEYISAYRYVLVEGSGSWSSQNDNYSSQSLLNYLDGLKDMELLAKQLGLVINFDARRKYEWDKYCKNRLSFKENERPLIKKKIFGDSNSKCGMLIHVIRVFISKGSLYE
ncbi:Glycosyl transferase family 2 [Butyrivibrio sp. ob235]|uniref:glycosyltransferase n=1 Tax=Butyrivibrio sp. ob235 TaxID=1761780 RepID=UPI0008D4AD20|nr:glycosyltransferase [Butyrivibrio sp. ob235]SEL73673.1 Glycosyl transferase family 2 [Butyrivibrio sp. ob235]